jgi:DNA-binding PadR family transcriptional regulator
MLAAELAALGGASASDERLLKRLGWTRGRAVQVLKQLEEKGIVTASMRPVEGGGRPRKVYELLMPLYG